MHRECVTVPVVPDILAGPGVALRETGRDLPVLFFREIPGLDIAEVMTHDLLRIPAIRPGRSLVPVDDLPVRADKIDPIIEIIEKCPIKLVVQ
jgi:hypothetical protein